jgi:hypothetical protein
MARLTDCVSSRFEDILELRLILVHGLEVLYILQVLSVFLASSYVLFQHSCRGIERMVLRILCC